MELCKVLLDNLNKKIFAKVPFPDVFKIKVLSEAWWSRFQSLGSILDDDEKDRARWFQKQLMREISKLIKIFCFEVLSHEESKTLRWVNFLTAGLSKSPSDSYLDGDIDVPLLCTQNKSKRCFQVANGLTRRVRQLPISPSKERGSYTICSKLVTSTDSYKVITISGMNLQASCQYFAEVYDSKSHVWTSTKLCVSFALLNMYHSAAFLNGVLYMMLTNNGIQYLAAYKLDGEALKKLELSLPLNWNVDVEYTKRANLVVCDDNLFMILMGGPNIYKSMTPCVLKVDLVSQQLEMVARCPLAFFDNDNCPILQTMSNRANILMFMWNTYGIDKLLTYNIKEILEIKISRLSIKRWTYKCQSFGESIVSSDYYARSIFEPGSNYLLEV